MAMLSKLSAIILLLISLSEGPLDLNVERGKAFLLKDGMVSDSLPSASGKVIKDAALGIWEGKMRVLIVEGRPGAPRGERLGVFVKKGNRWKLEPGGLITRWEPWKVRVGDVDGDGRGDILVGVWKKTHYDPVYDNRLFVFSWTEVGIFPKWLGSRLSRRFLDFEVISADSGRRKDVVALETLPEGKTRMFRYRWQGFGFVGAGEWSDSTLFSMNQRKEGKP